MDGANTDINTVDEAFSGERHAFTKEDQVKGGQSKSPRKALANSIKNLKHGRYSRYFTVAASVYIANPKASAELIYNLIEGVGNSNLSNKERIDLIKVLITAHQAVHGDKNTNYNTDTTAIEEFNKRLELGRQWYAEHLAKKRAVIDAKGQLSI